MNAGGQMAGKRVIVTGSGTGIGREVALEFARRGADVALHYCHSEAGAMSAVEQIRDLGRRAAAFGADFGDLRQVLLFAEQCIEFLGGVDVLVNNAGITFNRPFLEVTPAQFERLFSVNVRAQYFLTQRVAKEMIAGGGGAVCNISSIHGLQGAAEHSLYAATKGAIIAYTRALAVEPGRLPWSWRIEGSASTPSPRAPCPWKATVRRYLATMRRRRRKRRATPSLWGGPARRWTSPGSPSVRRRQRSSLGRPSWPTAGRRL